jgi:hypothetical protein
MDERLSLSGVRSFTALVVVRMGVAVRFVSRPWLINVRVVVSFV